ncbi:MAG: type I DNA topoisomerase, partial [Caulobacteraceae bacterium]
MNVVVVESPAKAKTINKYLGPGFTVLASYGHVRDLPSKDGSVKPDEDFAMSWEVDAKSSKRISDIADALKGADGIILATDPDREGEAISWHVLEILQKKKAIKDKAVSRVTFNAITKTAVLDAMANPRQIDMELVDAYLARRALDYLVGFTLSPVLWRKLPGSRSAGRVQSVSLRLVVDREVEIEKFRTQEYWSVDAEVSAGAESFTARLVTHQGKRLTKFDLGDEAAAMGAKAAVQATTFTVKSVEKKPAKRSPPPPFTTSTLQQEAARKLGFNAQRTMQAAQKLYEGIDIGGETTGLITYMRTDGVQAAPEALAEARDVIAGLYGKDYVPESARHYKTKAKNAQEAHEAIRPTSLNRNPGKLRLEGDLGRLYELIWKRMIASQMESARIERTTVDLEGADGATALRATGQVVQFPGYLAVYEEGRDDADDEDSARLPIINEGAAAKVLSSKADQHFTEPPPRYSEASLVKKMEELGIGRPSTYASILTVLRDRNYVRMDNKRFFPEDRGRLVTAFLTSFFERYVDPGFTASLEEQLDDISGGRAEWRKVMHLFWDQFSKAVEQTRDLKISDVIDALDKDLGSHFFPVPADGGDPRECPACRAGRLGLKLGRHGSFIGCSNYPTCEYTRRLIVEGGEEGGETLKEGKRDLGAHPENGENVTVRRGPYGLYVQQGDADPEDKKRKPRRTAIPRGMDGEQMTLDQAIGLLSLPRLVGLHPDRGEPIEAGIGRFGPFVKMGAIFASLDKDDDVLHVGLNRAVDALAKKLDSIRSIGTHPGDKQPVVVRKGRFGPYIQHGNTVANLPKDLAMDDVGLDEAVALLKEKGKALKPRPGSKKPAAKAKSTAT